MHTSMMMAVNSPPVPHRDISAPTATYRPYTEEYATVQRRVERPAQPEETERKKDKKWSIGKLFRRKKKEDESGSSSESDEGVSTRSPSKRKSKKKKKAPAVNNFDHIVIRDSRRAQSLAKPNVRDVTDDGVLSDPSAGFINYRAKTQDMYRASKESLSLREDNSNRSFGPSLESHSRKTRKGRLKARVEALRNSMKGESSSEEESLKSSNSSLMIRFRSEDSLMRSRDSSLNKRSRSARNERYIKRLSRDEENQLNKEAELLQQGYTKAEVEMLTRTPTSQSSGYGTCKRDQTQNVKTEQLYANDVNRRPMKSESISSFPSTQSYPSSINFNAKVNNEHINYSIPTSNINREMLYSNNNRERSGSNQYENADNVMCVKFPLGNVTNVKREEKAPPVPPPRDMQRKVATPISMYYENNPIIAERIANSQQTVQLHGVPNNDFERVMRRSQERSLSHSFNGLRRPISNSEDHIAMQNNEYIQNFQIRNEQPRRPASVSAEPNHYGLYANSPPWRKSIGPTNIVKPEPVQLRHDYLYYADQSPRSRRPISVKTSQNGHENQYLSDSQAGQNVAESVYRRPRNASDFWKKIDDAERQRRQQNMYANSRSSSDFSNSTQNRVAPYLEQNKVGQENTDIQNKNKTPFKSSSVDTTDGAKVWKATTEYKRSITVDPPKTVTSPTSKTHVRHKSDTYVPSVYQMPSDDEKSSERRKSTNLDDALNELEAIYNSLGLGDEDLLDRAERRELMTPKFNDQFNDWNGNDDEIQLRSQPTTPLRRVQRRSTLPDKLQDDMAFRRMNSLTKEKPNYKEAQAQISYMLASPVYVPYASDDDRQSERNEPDIVYDDVVYRNIKQTNSRLKTLDPQPPFGIPIGPVSPAPQSDYLHATPENKGRPRFIPRRSPDLVSDDLAYRSLRKDNRHSTHFNGEDYSGLINNNHSYSEYPYTKDSAANLKKKRAVRSLSANIFTMIQKEIDEALNMSKMATLQKTHSNSDVMKRLRNTFENNDNEQDHYPRNKISLEEAVEEPSEQYAEREEFENLYYALLASARQLVGNARRELSADSASEVVSGTSHTHKHTSVRLPKIDLPKFSGSYHDWLEFRDTFISIIHNNESIDKINKLHYLRASLKGSASLIIDNLDFRSDNYDAAWKLLCSRYDNKRLLVNNHVQAIFNVNSISRESSKALRHLVDTVNKNLRALSTLGQPVQYWDTLIIYIMTSRLDQVTNREWEEHRNSLSDPPTLDIFINFISNRADLLETLEESRPLKSRSEGTADSYHRSKSFALTCDSSNLKLLSCPMCKEKHFIFQCDQFRALPVQDRIKKAHASKVCLNCLRPGHHAQTCKLSHCKYCPEKHNTLLHTDKESPRTQNIVLSANHLNTAKVVLLSTAVVKVSDAEGNLHDARLLLDNGSTANFVTEDFCRKLRIHSYPITSNVKGINDQSSICSRGCIILIKAGHSEFEIELDCYVISQVSSSVPNTFIHTDNICLPSNIVLADPNFYTPSSIDILVGAEVFWGIIGMNRIPLGKNMPTLVDSKLGWIVTGVVQQPNHSFPHTSFLTLTDDLRLGLNRFWELDSVHPQHKQTCEERSCEDIFVETTYRDADGRLLLG